MEPPTEFTADSVRDYILSKGGKVTNHELVKHFKPFLTDPVMKDTARTQFKEYVNMLASIKLEDGEKYLVLKKKYRQGLLAEVLSDVGSEYSYVSQSTTGSTPDPPDLGLPPPRAPPPYRPPPPAPVPAPFPGPAPYQPPGAYSPTYRAVPAPGGPPPGLPGPYGGPPPGPYVGPPSPAASRNSMTMERSPALDEYYHVPESRPLADPQPVGLPPAPPPELWARSAPRRPAEQPPTRRQAPLPTPPPPPAESAEWRPTPPVDRPTPPMERPTPPMERAAPPTDLPVERRPPPAAEPSPDRPSPMDGEPAPPVPPRRRSMGKENQTPPPADAASSAEAEAARESAAEEERQKKISVKEQTQKFNRIASESQILQPKQLNKRRDRGDKTPVDDEDTSSTATFEGINKDWLLVSSSCKYMEIVRMLKDNPKLAKHKDFITGYTALHWAAKNGNLDVIKLIAGTHGVDVDSASHGGYTPLHVAMQYGHEDVFDLLVHTYGADPNVRDHSGKKPRQYMIREETTLSSEAFRKIKKKRHGSKMHLGDKDNSFLRIGSLNVRVKKTTEAFNSLISTGLQMGDRLHGRFGSSDSVNDAERELMPPPKFSIKKRKSKKPQDFQNLKSRISAPILQPGGGLPMDGGGGGSPGLGLSPGLPGAHPLPPDARRHSEADLSRISAAEDAISQGGSLRGDDSDSDYGFGSGWAG
ncbi:ankyrin repeat domain-containing protein SOWAHA-like [Amphibalanus amphitrite]|uniref:ankyrin repeat domain-containing protein SOWAHA-like n=1 Tax=Amphibalanus amphitrite TaxID=1232801 RepID=UPI001C92ABA8|nr:ankyrin repeat domain-containing protein SOWAHA-like [Amphibalanus amphitrite]